MFLRIRNQNCVLGRKPRWPPEGRAGRGRTTVRRKRSPNAELRVGPRNGINLGLAGPVSGVQVTPRRDARPSVSSCPRRKARGARAPGGLFAPTPDGRGRGSRVARLPRSRSRSRPFSFHSARDRRDEPETCRRGCWKTGAVRRGPAGGAPEPGGDAGTRHALRHAASDADADARAVATARSESAVRLRRRSSDPPAGGERAPRNRRLWPQEGECRAAPLREPLLQAPPASADFGVC